MNQWVNNSPPRTHEDCEKRNKIPPFNTVPVPLLDGTKQRGGEPTKLPIDPRSREGKVNGVGGSAPNGQTKACVSCPDPPSASIGDRGKKNATAPIKVVPVSLPDGTKQSGEPTKLPTDPRSRVKKINGVGGSARNGQTKARVLGSEPSPEPMGNERLDYACSRSCLSEEKSPGTHRKGDFWGQKSQNLAFNDSTSLPLFLHTATQHWEKITLYVTLPKKKKGRRRRDVR